MQSNQIIALKNHPLTIIMNKFDEFRRESDEMKEQQRSKNHKFNANSRENRELIKKIDLETKKLFADYQAVLSPIDKMIALTEYFELKDDVQASLDISATHSASSHRLTSFSLWTRQQNFLSQRNDENNLPQCGMK